MPSWSGEDHPAPAVHPGRRRVRRLRGVVGGLHAAGSPAAGFTIDFAYGLPETNEFIWAVSAEGDQEVFLAREQAYMASDAPRRGVRRTAAAGRRARRPLRRPPRLTRGARWVSRRGRPDRSAARSEPSCDLGVDRGAGDVDDGDRGRAAVRGTRAGPRRAQARDDLVVAGRPAAAAASVTSLRSRGRLPPARTPAATSSGSPCRGLRGDRMPGPGRWATEAIACRARRYELDALVVVEHREEACHAELVRDRVSSGSASACRSCATPAARAAMRRRAGRARRSRATRPWSSRVRSSRYATERGRRVAARSRRW